MAEVIRMPQMSDTMEEGVIAEWHKKVGDKVDMAELLAEIETDKATMDFESPAEGILLYIGVKKGEAIPINGILAVVGEKGEDYKSLIKEEPAKKTEVIEAPVEVTVQQPELSEQPQTTNGRIKASPLAKRLAKENSVNLSVVKGTGDEGRIIKRDIEAMLTSGAQQPSLASFVTEESAEEIPLSQMRKTIAKRLSQSKFSAPHFYLTMEINMDRAMEMRKSINAELAPEKVSINDFIIKASTMALRLHPNVNASWGEDKIIVKKHIHIGVAVAVDAGLIVPVVKFADNKPISQIAREVRALAGKAKEGSIKLDELQGNTFTISNLGMFDIDEFTAIINSPDSCILAVGKIKATPIVKEGNIAAGNMMKVTLSCDHRVVDGAMGAQFLQSFKGYLEEPVRLLAREF